jgi:hypothetical protein
MASTELLADDDEPAMALRYPVDDITVATPCELHVKVVNITMKVAVGYALPIRPNPTYHCTPVPHGYIVAEVDQVVSVFEQLKLDYPAGEGDFYELGEAQKTTVLWPKEYIVLPNWTPRSPARHPSLPRELSMLPHPTPAHRPSPPLHQPSPPPPPTETESKKHKCTITAPLMSRNRSSIHRQEPLPKVPKIPAKRPYNCTPEENAVIVNEKVKNFFAKKKPEPPALDPKKVQKMLKTLHQPEPRLSSDYERSILKSYNTTKVRSRGSSASEKLVPQLGE